MNRKLNHLYGKSKSKSFNFSLCGIVITVCFLAAYIRYLLTKEGKNIELFSWLPDRGRITNWNDEITIYGSTDWWTSMLNIEEQAKLEKIHFEEGEYLWKLPKKE